MSILVMLFLSFRSKRLKRLPLLIISKVGFSISLAEFARLCQTEISFTEVDRFRENFFCEDVSEVDRSNTIFDVQKLKH